MPACTLKTHRQTSHPKKPLPASLHKSIPYPPPNHEQTSACEFPQPNALGCLFYFVLWQERRIKLPGLSGRTSSLPYIIIITRSLGERKCSKSLKYKAIKTAGSYCRDCHAINRQWQRCGALRCRAYPFWQRAHRPASDMTLDHMTVRIWFWFPALLSFPRRTSEVARVSQNRYLYKYRMVLTSHIPEWLPPVNFFFFFLV